MHIKLVACCLIGAVVLMLNAPVQASVEQAAWQADGIVLAAADTNYDKPPRWHKHQANSQEQKPRKHPHNRAQASQDDQGRNLPPKRDWRNNANQE